MAEVLLYHLERQPLERVLPVLIERTLARGWRAVVQAGSEERVEAISAALWTAGDETPSSPTVPRVTATPILQPVWITASGDNPNGARVRFMVDGEFASDVSGLDRVIFMFDGRDEEMCERARQVWQDARAQGHDATYWRQDAGGRWQKQT